MQLEERIVGDIAVVKVTGEITMKKGGDTTLHDKVRSLIQQGHTRLLVDLAGVSYVDSAGLGELVHAYSTTRNHGGLLRLFNPSGRLRDLLVITQLTTLFGKYDYEGEAQALASFGTPRS